MTAMTTFPAPKPSGSAADIISRNVRRLMVERNVTQGQLAQALDVKQTNVSKRLRGQTPWTTDDLDALTAAFGVDLSELVAQHRPIARSVTATTRIRRFGDRTNTPGDGATSDPSQVAPVIPLRAPESGNRRAVAS